MTSQTSCNRDDGRKIMHPIKESSQEDMLKLSPDEPIGTQKFIVASAAPPPLDARPPPVPPKSKRPVSEKLSPTFFLGAVAAFAHAYASVFNLAVSLCLVSRVLAMKSTFFWWSSLSCWK